MEDDLSWFLRHEHVSTRTPVGFEVRVVVGGVPYDAFRPTFGEAVAEIRQRCEAATEGPWSRDNPPVDHEGCRVWPWDRGEDMEFAYRARTDIPRLLAHAEVQDAEVERLRAENAKLREVIAWSERARKATDGR